MNTAHKFRKYGLDIFTTFREIEGINVDQLVPEDDSDVFVELTETGVNLSAIIANAKISDSSQLEWESLKNDLESVIYSDCK